MNTSSDAAETVVRLSLQGLEVAAKISGSGAKHIAAMLLALMKDKNKVKGRTALTNLLKSGKELKVFSIKDSDLKKFVTEAKKYGVLFSVIKNKDGDGITDIMVRSEDAGKINRIVEKFKFADVDTTTIKSEVQEKSNKDMSAEEVMEDIINSSKEIENKGLNPSKAKAEESPLSKPSSNNKKFSDQDSNSKKPSVKEKLKEIKKELDKSGKQSKDKKLSKTKTKSKKRKKAR